MLDGADAEGEFAADVHVCESLGRFWLRRPVGMAQLCLHDHAFVFHVVDACGKLPVSAFTLQCCLEAFVASCLWSSCVACGSSSSITTACYSAHVQLIPPNILILRPSCLSAFRSMISALNIFVCEHSLYPTCCKTFEQPNVSESLALNCSRTVGCLFRSRPAT